MSGDVLVRTVEVTRAFGLGDLTVPVLHGVSLSVRAGELCLLMGPSGSGKTTLLSILAGLLRPTTGAVELCGVPISSLPDAASTRVRRANLGFVFQTYNLFPALTALDNVAEVLSLKGVALREARARAVEALQHVGLGSRMHHRPGELSGGQKQRVAIARALAGDPRLVLGDEITAALDSATGMAMMDLLRGLVDARRGVLLVTHDHRLERYADRVIEIEDGHITADRAGGFS
ncbi:MAG: ABC transporter ATP-binding protein [Polyangiales bacterium]